MREFSIILPIIKRSCESVTTLMEDSRAQEKRIREATEEEARRAETLSLENRSAISKREMADALAELSIVKKQASLSKKSKKSKATATPIWLSI